MTTPSSPGTSGHAWYDELAAGWVLRSLEPDDEARFVEHLPTCERCQRAVADYTGALAELSFAMPQAEPPASLGERIRSAVAQDKAASIGTPEQRRSEPLTEPGDPTQPGRPGQPDAAGGSDAPDGSGAEPTPAGLRPAARAADETSSRPPTPSPISRRTPFGTRGRATRWLAAAAAVVVVALGIGNVVQYQQARSAQQRADREAAALSEQQQQAREEAERRSSLIRLLAQPGVQATRLGTPDGRTLGYVVVQDGRTQVLADGLPRNDPGTNQYVLWYVAATGGSPRPLSGFDVTSAEIDLRSVGQLPSVPGGIKAFAVSIEPGRQVPTSPTKVLGGGTVES